MLDLNALFKKEVLAWMSTHATALAVGFLIGAMVF